MTVSGCNIFIYFLSVAIPRMGTLFVYIQIFVFYQYREKQREFSFSYPLFIFVHLFIFILWYQSSNLRALVATFIMAKIINRSQDFSLAYHVSSQQHMICSLDTQQERQSLVVMKDDILLKSTVIVERQDM